MGSASSNYFHRIFQVNPTKNGKRNRQNYKRGYLPQLWGFGEGHGPVRIRQNLKNRETVFWRKACTESTASIVPLSQLQLQGLSTPHNHFHHTHSQLPNHPASVVSNFKPKNSNPRQDNGEIESTCLRMKELMPKAKSAIGHFPIVSE